jgi:hypothetical protein
MKSGPPPARSELLENICFVLNRKTICLILILNLVLNIRRRKKKNILILPIHGRIVQYVYLGSHPMVLIKIIHVLKEKNPRDSG